MNLFRRGVRRKRLSIVAFAGTLMAFQTLALIGAGPASAAFATCSFSGGVINVTLASGNTVAFDEGAATEITIDTANTTTACTSATNATLSNTTAINVTGNTGDEEVDINLDVDWGTINWTISLLTGSADDLFLDGSTIAPADGFTATVGATGVDFNGDGDNDITLSGAENVDIAGSAGDDTVSGAGDTATGAAATADIGFTGIAGDDYFTSGAGNDTFDGGAGENTADYSAATGAVNGNLTSNIASGTGVGVDSIPNVQDLVGSAQGDTLTGADVEDNIITGGAGDDTIDCVGDATDEDTADFSDSAAAVIVDLGAGTATGDGTDKLSNCEDVQGSDLADTITGDDNDNALFGGAGNDILKGGDGVSDGADTLDGESGSDWADYSDRTHAVSVNLTDQGAPGFPAGDFVDGETAEGDAVNTENVAFGTGDDTFVGNAFNNTVQPGGGQNSLTGGGGGDTVDYSVGYAAGVTVNLAGGGTSDDAFTDLSFVNAIGTAFADNITGGDGSNVLKSRKGNDNVRAGSGDDTVKAGAGNDLVRAGSGDDDLWGQKGNDSLNGGSGDDFCKGGPGVDKLKSCESGHK
jgi:hypothetical protein